MLAVTVSSNSTTLWLTIAIWARRLGSAISSMLRPSSRISPLLALKKLGTRLTSVDLPPPDARERPLRPARIGRADVGECQPAAGAPAQRLAAGALRRRIDQPEHGL